MKNLIILLLTTSTLIASVNVTPIVSTDLSIELPQIQPPPLIEITPTYITLQDFSLDKGLSYTRPNGNSGFDNDEYFYNIASFTVDTAGTYNVLNTVFNANYVGVDRTFENETNLLSNGTPSWMADTMIYVYDQPFNPRTPTNPLFFADNDDNADYDGDGDGDLLFNLTADLITDTTYYGVITTYEAKVAGDGWMAISGPSAVTLNMGIIPEPSTYALITGWIAFLYVAILRRRKSHK